MKKAKGWNPTTVRKHAVNVAEAMVKDLDALTHPSFLIHLDNVLKKHGFQFKLEQMGIRGTRATIERTPYMEKLLAKVAELEKSEK